MYQSFRVQNYRGFQDLELRSLSRINLIGGKNNVGKTSLLEAIFIFIAPYNSELWFRVNFFRGIQSLEVSSNSQNLIEEIGLDALFHQWDIRQPIVVSGKALDGQETRYNLLLQSDTAVTYTANGTLSQPTRQLSMEITNQDDKHDVVRIVAQNNQVSFESAKQPASVGYFFPLRLPSHPTELIDIFSTVVERGEKSKIIEALKVIEPRLTELELLRKYGQNFIAGNIGDGKLRPLNFMGDGIVRALQFVLSIYNARNGVVLIDEIEAGFHYGIQTDIWKVIYKMAQEFNVQIFATTHSLEMIRAAHEAFADHADYPFSYYRLDRDLSTQAISATRYNQEAIHATVEFDVEVR